MHPCCDFISNVHFNFLISSKVETSKQGRNSIYIVTTNLDTAYVTCQFALERHVP